MAVVTSAPLSDTAPTVSSLWSDGDWDVMIRFRMEANFSLSLITVFLAYMYIRFIDVAQY